nr:DUF481 domain-containing protein [uncultured Carboxylicivirga sp.]
MRTLILFAFFVFILLPICSAQVDSVRFSNGQLMIGEIKSMERGVLVIETDYSDSDFEIEWKKVVWLRTKTNFMVDLENGEEYFSNINSVNDSLCQVINPMGLETYFKPSEVVNLKSYEDSFKDRFSAFIDLSYEMAKAKSLKRFTTRSGLGYQAEKWNSNFTISSLLTSQEDAEDIQRTESELNTRYVMKNWYSIVTISTLSNSEQQLNLRLNTQLGMARYLHRTNKTYWGIVLGANRNVEKYYESTSDRQTWEGYFTMELNLYDVEDFSLLFSSSLYCGITENGRWRSDTKLDIKYDLPLDFYIKFGATLNYDNRPIEGVSTTDYILQSGIGWEW